MVNIIHPALPGPHRMEQFRARSGQNGIDEALLFGIVRYDDVAGVAPRVYLIAGSNQQVRIGDVLVRPLLDDGAGNLVDSTARWAVLEGGLEAVRNAIQVRTSARDVPIAGQPMKTPLGHTIYDVAGNTIPQPAPGEPARDQWTGGLTGSTVPL